MVFGLVNLLLERALYVAFDCCGVVLSWCFCVWGLLFF